MKCEKFISGATLLSEGELESTWPCSIQKYCRVQQNRESPALNWARSGHLSEWTKALKQPSATPDKPKKNLAKAKRWQNLSIHSGKQPTLISNYFEACTEGIYSMLSTEPSCTPQGTGTGNPNANTEEPSVNTQQSTVDSCIPVREGSGDPKSEDFPCSGDIAMIMDSLREFVIDTDPLRNLFSHPVA